MLAFCTCRAGISASSWVYGMVGVGVLLTVTVTIDITPYCYLPIEVLASPEAKHRGFATYINAMNTASRYMPSARRRHSTALQQTACRLGHPFLYRGRRN